MKIRKNDLPDDIYMRDRKLVMAHRKFRKGMSPNTVTKVANQIKGVKQAPNKPKELTQKQKEYRAYLETPHWKEMKAKALDAADHKCQLCYSNNNLNVHHRTYERLWEERISDLTVLCSACHSKFHNKLRRI